MRTKNHATIELVGVDELEVAEHVLLFVLSTWDGYDADDWSIEMDGYIGPEPRTFGRDMLAQMVGETMWYAKRTPDPHGNLDNGFRGWRIREAGEPCLQKFSKAVLTIRSKALLKEFLYEVRWRSQPADGYVLQEAARSIIKTERASRRADR